MKNILNRMILAGVLCTVMIRAFAQNNGITMSFLNAAFYANTSPFTQGYMGIGYERNAGDYITLKLEINKGFQVLYNLTDGKVLGAVGNSGYERSYVDSQGYNQIFYYHWSVPSFDINYQSKFFFAGNDHTGAYLSMGIGMRKVKYIFHVGSPEDYGDYDAPKDIERKDNYEETVTVIPLILRIGARGDLKGFYPDFSFGLGYNLSHNKTLKDKTITKTYDLTIPKLSGLAITAGISFGVGW